MQGTIRIGIFQPDISWNKIHLNQQKIEKILAENKTNPEVLILPEMYATGYSINPKEFSVDEINCQANWQIALSQQYNIGIIGSTVIFEEGFYLNRLLFTHPEGKVDYYDKRHLFRMGDENLYYKSGKNRKLFEYKGIKIMPQICYDLRFPVWSRNDSGYHLLIYSANWPANRKLVWDTLLPARAIENQCYVIGVNRVGTDNNDISYEGGSAVYNPKGELLLKLENREEYSEITISIDELVKFRESFPAFLDADSFEITG